MSWLDALPNQAGLDGLAAYYANSPKWATLTTTFGGGDARFVVWLRFCVATMELLGEDMPRVDADVWRQMYEMNLSPGDAVARVNDFRLTGRSVMAGRLTVVPAAG